ncbi:uncharacterized protein LOC17899285 [Capsella rubella]|nr:uncharacterized protein LOC17899285 [Capsella rubella]XP_023632919.1 uncharacterized protein LOC17899285 [Capsella rubella]
MEPPPQRSKRLHNFPLPQLRWGQQRYLRCVNLPSSNSHHPSPSPDHPPNRSVSTIAGVSNDKLKEAKNGDVVAAARPWNLRTRRAACSEPGDESPAKNVGVEIGLKRSLVENDDEKLKFSIPLSREEIEQDFFIAFGKKPPRRPKKRPRLVQKKLNTIFPGLWLDEEVTIDSYNGPGAMET